MNGSIANNESYEQLACAIVFQAIKDYALCIEKSKLPMRNAEDEKFYQEIKQLLTDSAAKRTAYNNRNSSEQYRVSWERWKKIEIREVTPEERKRYKELRKTTINEETRNGLKDEMKSIENFIKGKWYGKLTSIKPELLLNRLHAMKYGQVNWQPPKGRKKSETQ